MSTINHLNIKIIGQVQGVGFRYSTQNKAKELEIKGFARNESDNSVYIEAEGEEENLNKFVQWVRQGVSSAQIEKVEVKEGEVKNFDNFLVK